MRLVGGKLVGDNDEPLESPVLTEVTDDGNDTRKCETCGTGLYYAGRGRPPRFCEEHKPISPNRTGSTSPRRNTTLRNEGALREALAARYMLIAQISQWRRGPVVADNIRSKIDRAVEADINYAKVNPSFRKLLEAMVEKTAAGEVVAVHIAIFGPLVVGEVAQRSRKQSRPNSQGEGESRQPNATTQPQPPPQPPAQPDNVRNLRDAMPAEHEGSSAETVNAGAMEGMPSL